jgi:4'-phosphopantetheinyl transferase
MIWWMKVDSLSTQVCGWWSSVLSREENERAASFTKEQDRVQFVAAHALLRAMLNACGGIALDCRFVIGPYGKPRLHPDHHLPDLDFNISHTLGAVACGISLGATIGVDIENHTRMTNSLDIAAAYFGRDELATLREAPEANRDVLFYKFWTLKEAALKATGRGLSVPLSDIVFTLAPVRARIVGTQAVGNWRFISNAVSEFHTLAVALCGHRQERLEVRLRRIDCGHVVRLVGVPVVER